MTRVTEQEKSMNEGGILLFFIGVGGLEVTQRLQAIAPRRNRPKLGGTHLPNQEDELDR